MSDEETLSLQGREYKTFQGNESEDTLTRQVSNISRPESKAGILGTSFNLVNTIIGAGIFGMPFAIKESGIVAGPVLLALVAWLTNASNQMLVSLASFHPKLKNLGVLTYEDLMGIPFSNVGKRFVLISMMFVSYSFCMAYLLVIKDTLPTVLHCDNTTREKQLVLLLTSVLIPLPLSSMRDMASLASASFYSLVADVFLFILVLVSAPISNALNGAGGLGQVIADNWINSHVFIGIGTFSAALVCQHSIFLMSMSLENLTAKRWGVVSQLSIAVSGLLTLAMGIFGYLGFLDQTKGDILNNFDVNSKTINLGRTALAMHMSLVYPLESYVCRHVIIQLFFDGDMDGPRRMKWFPRYRLLSIVVYIFALVPAMLVNDLGIVLSLTGAFASSTVAHVAPGFAYIGINGEHFIEETRTILTGSGYTHTGTSISPLEQDIHAVDNMCKPWWWYVAGFPLWWALAKSGSRNTAEFLSKFEDADESGIAPPSEGIFVQPSLSGYLLSMFFISFGVITLILGVGSNIAAMD